MNLRLPPFGRILQAYQHHQVLLKKMIYIYVGKTGKEDACYWIKYGEVCTFLPYGEDFNLYDWPVSDQVIIVNDTGGMEEAVLKCFCALLLEMGAKAIFLYCDGIPKHENQYYFNGVNENDNIG